MVGLYIIWSWLLKLFVFPLFPVFPSFIHNPTLIIYKNRFSSRIIYNLVFFPRFIYNRVFSFFWLYIIGSWLYIIGSWLYIIWFRLYIISILTQIIYNQASNYIMRSSWWLPLYLGEWVCKSRYTKKCLVICCSYYINHNSRCHLCSKIEVM